MCSSDDPGLTLTYFTTMSNLVPYAFVWRKGHMAKMASRLIYGKTLEKILLRNQEADDLETWYTASGTQVLSNFFK